MQQVVANDTTTFNALQRLGITVTSDMMLGNQLNLPDEYASHPDDSTAQPPPIPHYLELTRPQYEQLIVAADDECRADMGSWLLLGVRDIDDNHWLAAYYVSNGLGYSVYLITYDRQATPCDVLDLRELHVLWPVDRERAGQCDVRTLDAYVTFAGKRHLTLHRLMTECHMDYENGTKGAPHNQLAWEQDYDITQQGVFVLKEQKETLRNGNVDSHADACYKAWDLLVCSRHDASITDTWNQFVPQLEDTYDHKDPFNPYWWNLPRLYAMNPQRFLTWMAHHRGTDNRLLRYWQVDDDKRDEVASEIDRIDDANARQWLNNTLLNDSTLNHNHSTQP